MPRITEAPWPEPPVWFVQIISPGGYHHFSEHTSRSAARAAVNRINGRDGWRARVLQPTSWGEAES